MLNIRQVDFKKYNFSLISIVLVLCSIGAFVIRLVENEGEGLFEKQLIGIALGLCIAFTLSLIDYHFVCKMYIPVYIFNIGLLFAVKLFGSTLNQSKRWIQIGPVSFQPSELSKVILIIVLAQVLVMLGQRLSKWWAILISIVVAAIPTLLIMDQPDLSSSLVSVFIFVIMIFVAGLSYKIIIPIIMIGVPSAAILFWYIQQDFQKLLDPYQQKRVLSILNPEQYGALMYQQTNSVAAISAGGLYGKLINPSAGSYRAYKFVPISESDFIFSVVGEEFGFIGCCIFFGLFLLLIFQCIQIAKTAPDRLGRYVATGISAMFMFQVFANIGVATAFLPNTGLPLPFISSGLSSLIGSMIAIGLLLNVSKQRKKARG